MKQSLADYLGTSEPVPDAPAAEPMARLSAKKFSEAVLNSPEFHRYVVNSLSLGDIPPAIITRMMDYAWGKPVEKLELKDTTNPLEELRVDQLEARALYLANLARQMRESVPKLPAEDDAPPSSIH